MTMLVGEGCMVDILIVFFGMLILSVLCVQFGARGILECLKG